MCGSVFGTIRLYVCARMCVSVCLAVCVSVCACVGTLEEDALFPVFPVVVTSLMEDALQYHGSHFCPLHCDGAEVLIQPGFGSFSET